MSKSVKKLVLENGNSITTSSFLEILQSAIHKALPAYYRRVDSASEYIGYFVLEKMIGRTVGSEDVIDLIENEMERRLRSLGPTRNDIRRRVRLFKRGDLHSIPANLLKR